MPTAEKKVAAAATLFSKDHPTTMCILAKKALLLLGTTRVDEVGSVSSIRRTDVMEGQTTHTHTFTLAFILFPTSDLKRPPAKLGYCRRPRKVASPF